MTDKQKRQEKKQAPRAGWFGGEILHAIKYGDREAIMISGFLYMIREIWGDDDYLYDGRYYKPITLDGLCRFFPMWSKMTVRTVKDSLIKQGVLVTHDNNKGTGDRTTNYAFHDERKFLNVGLTPQENEVTEAPYVENNTSGHVLESTRVHVLESTHPHIYNILDNISHVQSEATTANASVCAPAPVRGEEVTRERDKLKAHEYTPDFESFWKLYPKKVNKEEAFKKWKQAIKIDSIKTITSGLRWDIVNNFSKEQRYQPNLATWLHNKRWLNAPQSVLCSTNLNLPESESAHQQKPKPKYER